MEHEALLVLAHQRIDDLLIAPGPERCHHQCLRFATRKECRAVRSGQHAHANADRPNRARVAAVDSRLAVQDLVADDSRFELEAYFLHHVRVGPAFLAHADLFVYALPDAVYRLGTRLFLAQRERSPQLAFGQLLDAPYERLILLRRFPVPGGLCGFVSQFVNRLDCRLHLLVAENNRAEHDVLGKLLRLRFHHQHRVLGARYH